MQEALPLSTALSGELFSGICLASSEIPLCLCNDRVVKASILGCSLATRHRNLS